MIRRLCVIGVGLIGGSLSRALREGGHCTEIVGSGRRAENLQRAVELGVIDRYEVYPAKAVRGADMVVLAVPLGSMAQVFAAIRDELAPDAILTDVGSAKGCVLEAARAAFGELPARLVPAHPIAGTEQSGVEASFASLFDGRRVIITPHDTVDPSAVEAVRAMWESAGADVVSMNVDHHDEVLAATSHLPHILAYTLVDVLGRMEERVEIFRYAAGGFTDFTRIASSDPQMWHDICLANRDALVTALEHFESELHAGIEAVRTGDSEAMKTLFVRAKSLRDRYTNETEPSS